VWGGEREGLGLLRGQQPPREKKKEKEAGWLSGAVGLRTTVLVGLNGYLRTAPQHNVLSAKVYIDNKHTAVFYVQVRCFHLT
jgi:hypothetical protein